MKRVLITRDGERAAELATILTVSGFEVHVRPVTRTRFIDVNPLPDLTRYRWIVFTSVNGVIGFEGALRKQGLLMPTEVLVGAIGTATGDACATRLRKPIIVSQDSNATRFADELMASDDKFLEGKIIWPCATGRRPDFEKRMKEAGVSVKPWECYSTEAIPANDLRPVLAANVPWDVVVFAAPSAVRAFSAAWPPPWHFESVAIGRTTADALIQCGVGSPLVSHGTSANDLSAAVVQALAESKPDATRRGTL